MGNKQETGHSRQIRRAGTVGKLVLAAGLTLGGGVGVEAFGTSGHAAGQTTMGDVDCDGQSNSIDASLVLQKTAGLVDFLACGQAGDVNGDHILNAIDAALILQYNAGLIDEFPIEPKSTATATRTSEPAPTRTPTRSPTETPTATPTPEPGPNYELAQGIAVLINEKRQELGLNQLTLDPAIVSAANEYAKFLFDNPSLGVDHNLDGLDPGQRAERYGYQGGWTGEILAAMADLNSDYATPEFFMQGWLDSPSHFSIMTDPNATDIGVGCYQGLRQIHAIQQILNICVGNFGRSS